MRVNVLSDNKEMRDLTNEAYGDQRIDYNPFWPRLGNSGVSYEPNFGGEVVKTTTSYSLSQGFPEDSFSARFKEAASEIAQVHAKPNEFGFKQYGHELEFKIGNAGKGSRGKLSAEIIKNLLKQHDFMAFNGAGGNYGYKTHPNTNAVAVSGTINFDFIKDQIDLAINRIKSELGLTSEQLSNIKISWGAGVENVMTSIEAGQLTTNKQRLYDAYPEIAQSSIFEMNSFILSSLQMIITYAPVITPHYASVPAAIAEAEGKYGRSVELLFGMESIGVDVEAAGACQVVNMSAA